jgi:recombination protein U
MPDPKRQLAGLRSHRSGEEFERLVTAACRFYEDHGFCAIDKTPEPMKVLRPIDRRRGEFAACFTKQAQPDFKGILSDGTMILFDAKHTDTDRIQRGVISDEQEACFDRYMKLGARCYVVISVRFEGFYRVPWEEFRDMKTLHGHKYMDTEELSPYGIKYREGVLRILDGIELKGE